ncbi:MAG: hypothetical protein ACLQUY_17590 [Ktedonobacterales bacterium]
MWRLAPTAARLIIGCLIGLVLGLLLTWILYPKGIAHPSILFLLIPVSFSGYSTTSLVVPGATVIALLAGIGNELGSIAFWRTSIATHRLTLIAILIAIALVCGSAYLGQGTTAAFVSANYPAGLFAIAAILVFALMSGLLTAERKPEVSSLHFSLERLRTLVLLGLSAGGAFSCGLLLPEFAGVGIALLPALPVHLSADATQYAGGLGIPPFILILIAIISASQGAATAVTAGVVIGLIAGLTLGAADLVTQH